MGGGGRNPTGTLDMAPHGVPRILCVCTFGLETGVALRHRTERILQSMGVDAWLEVAGKADAPERSQFADLVLVTRDEEADAEEWGRTAILDNECDPAQIRSALVRFFGNRPATMAHASRGPG